MTQPWPQRSLDQDMEGKPAPRHRRRINRYYDFRARGPHLPWIFSPPVLLFAEESVLSSTDLLSVLFLSLRFCRRLTHARSRLDARLSCICPVSGRRRERAGSVSALPCCATSHVEKCDFSGVLRAQRRCGGWRRTLCSAARSSRVLFVPTIVKQRTQAARF